MLTKEITFVIAGQLTRGNEIREQEYYYETIAILFLIGKSRGWFKVSVANCRENFQH